MLILRGHGMENLENYQKSLINGSLDNVKDIIDHDYSIGKLNRALASLKEYLVILPKYKSYARQQIRKIMNFYRREDRAFYQKYHRMNSKYIEVVLNLSNFK